MVPFTHASQPDPIDGLISHLSHDLKAPVRAIVEIASWIDEELGQTEKTRSDDIEGYLKLLRIRSDRLQTLITDLTTYARVGLSQERFDGNWDALIGSVKAKTPALERFELSCRLEAIPHVTQRDLDTLICALLSNATKHHHIGHGHIDLSVVSRSNGCCLTVSDDGPGIQADRREQALQMLVTLNTRDVVEGSGIGLSIVQRIVEHYGGTLELGPSSQGCSVSVGLPSRS